MAADQVTDGKKASGVGKPQVFRSSTAILVWWVWVLFAVANLIDLAVQGRDHLSLVAAGILVMVTGVAYVAAQRPRVIVLPDVLTVRNPLRDHLIPWENIARVDVSDLLRVHYRLPGQEEQEKVISAWAVHYSRRRQYSAEVKARRDAMRSAGPRTRRSSMTAFGIPQPAVRRTTPTSYAAQTQPEVEALKIVRALNDRATAAGIERATERDSDQGTILAGHDPAGRKSAGAELLTSTWSWRAFLALAVPAVILLIVCLI
jgi:Bacterial PH domain